MSVLQVTMCDMGQINLATTLNLMKFDADYTIITYTESQATTQVSIQANVITVCHPSAPTQW